jgi:RNA polymerase-binding transcription factor DksA
MDGQASLRLLKAERERLLEVRRGLEAELPHESEGESAAELSVLDQHQADIGSEMFEREKDLSILLAIDSDLRAVSDAIARLERGVYGRCEACDAPIPDDRLEAVPATRFCIEHETRWELEQAATSPVDEAPFAGDIAAREGARHPEFLPAEEAEEEADLAPEESAMHVTRSPGGTGADR